MKRHAYLRRWPKLSALHVYQVLNLRQQLYVERQSRVVFVTRLRRQSIGELFLKHYNSAPALSIFWMETQRK